MANKGYAMNVWIILGASAALMLFIFILVDHHRGMSDRVRQDRSALRASGSSGAERSKPVGQVSVPAAESRPAKKATAAPPPGRDGK